MAKGHGGDGGKDRREEGDKGKVNVKADLKEEQDANGRRPRRRLMHKTSPADVLKRRMRDTTMMVRGASRNKVEPLEFTKHEWERMLRRSEAMGAPWERATMAKEDACEESAGRRGWACAAHRLGTERPAGHRPQGG